MKISLRSTPIIILAVLIAVLLFGWFVWPTHYKYTEMHLGMLGKQKIRTERFTGQQQVYGDDKWQKIIISPDGSVTIPGGTTIIVGPQ